MSNSKSKVDWKNIVIGIIFILGALAVFGNPLLNMKIVLGILSVIAVIEGIYQIFFRRKIKLAIGYKSTAMLVMGLIDIVVGTILIFNLNEGVVAMSYVFAIWFILKSIEGLMTSGIAKVVSKGYYWLKIIVSILGIVIGILLFKNPLTSIVTVSYLIGINFMAIGILYIIEAFTNKEEIL